MLTSPCLNVITPTLAFVVPHLAKTLYFSGGSDGFVEFLLFELNEVAFVDIFLNRPRARFDINVLQKFQLFELLVFGFSIE